MCERLLNKGDRVTVFEDCLSEHRPEGEAVVVKQSKYERHPENRETEMVKVRFDGDGPGMEYWRYVRMDKYSVNGKRLIKEAQRQKGRVLN